VSEDIASDMLFLADQAMSRKEIIKFLTLRADAYMREREGRASREMVEKMLQQICDGHHWSNYQRRKTVEQIAVRSCRRYHWIYREWRWGTTA
jgi:hypothetical protein